MLDRKTLYFNFVTCLMLILLASLPAHAVTLSVDDTSGVSGATITVPVMVDDAEGIGGYQFKISYNPAILSCSTVQKGSLTSSWNLPTFDVDNTAGTVFVMSMDIFNGLPSGVGSLAKLVFQIIGEDPGQISPLTFSDCYLYDTMVQSIAFTTSNGQVTVSEPPLPTIVKSTSSINFGTTATSSNFLIWNGGSGTINYTLEITSGGSYFTLTPPLTGSSTGSTDNQPHTVTVNRSGIAEGATVSGRITITPDEAGILPQTISLSASKATTPPPPPPPQYTLTTQVIGGNGTISPTGGSYASGTTVNLTATPASGYKIKQWTGTNNDTLLTNTNKVTMTSNKTVSVEFEQIPVVTYTLTATVSGGNGTISPTSGNYNSGTVVGLTATPASGYKVSNWSGTDNNASPATTNTVTMNSNKTVTVTFTKIQYTLTAQVIGGNGTVSPASGTYDVGTTVTLTANPNNQYQVAKWTGTNNDTSTSETNTVTINTNKQVTVRFAKVPYTLTTSVAAGMGTITPAGEVIYESGTVVPLHAQPDACYHITGWAGTENDASTASENSVLMDGNKSVSVTFAMNMYELTAQVNGGNGSLIVNPDSVNYDCGTQVQLTAVPDPYYRVKSWTGTENDASTSTQNAVIMNANKQVTVEFENTPVFLTYSQIGGSSQGQPSIEQFSLGEVIPLSVLPLEPGYRVRAWHGTDDDSSLEPTNSVTMNSDKNVIVELAQILEPQKCTVKVEKTQGQCAINVAGVFDATYEQVSAANSLNIEIWSFDHRLVYGETLAYDPGLIKKEIAYKYTYKVPKDGPGAISSFMYNLKTQKFALTASKINLLEGLKAPFIVDIQLGDFIGMVEATENIVNGSKLLTMQLLLGFEDALRVDKCLFKLGTNKKEGMDSLSVQGAISVADTSVNLNQIPVTIRWADSTFEIPAGQFVAQKGAKYMCRKYQNIDEGWLASGTIDLDKCIFKLAIKNAPIGLADNPVDFTVEFEQGAYIYQQTDSLNMTEKNSTTFVYP